MIKKKTGKGKRTQRKTARRGGMGGRSRPTKSNKGNYATLIEAFSEPLVLNTGANLRFNLAMFQRAQEVAHAYKYYRLKKVELDFIPYANINTVGGAAATRLPQMYGNVDRVGNMNILPSENEMLERGIRPILFKSIIKKAFKPSNLQYVNLETNQPAEGGGLPLGINVINAINSIPIYDKWLPTQQSYGFTPLPPTAQTGQEIIQPASNPYVLNYYGYSFIINQDGGTPPVECGELQVRITWEYKGARALKTVAPLPFTYPITDSATSMMNTGVVANTQPTSYP